MQGRDQGGATDEEDKALATDLLSDEKETAEHRMLVDLGRNDIGRISETASVQSYQVYGSGALPLRHAFNQCGQGGVCFQNSPPWMP